MAKNPVKPAVLALAVIGWILLPGCSAGKPYIDVIRGNYAFQQGKFPESTLLYLSTMKLEEHIPWTAYNLGNVYHALGEGEAALEVWEKCAGTQDQSLLFRVHFNRGTLYYETGRYRDAYDEFRSALGIDSRNIDAKINLELSLQKIQAQSNAGGGRDRVTSGRQEENSETRRILEYVRRKEGERWTQADQSERESTTQDW